jgi:hypothetical protein
MTVLPVLIVVVIISAMGFGMIGVMNTDITHATIQGVVSRSFFVAQAGAQNALVCLKGPNPPVCRTQPYPTAVSPVSFSGGQFWVWVEDHGGTESGYWQVTSRGRATTAGRTVTAEVRVIVGPLNIGLFGESTVAAQGANSRTYLAPWRTVAPGVPRAPNMGSFLDINFQDNGTRLNAVSETSADTVTLRGVTFNDWELYGFTTRPVYDPNDTEPWILAVFGDIIKAQPDTNPWLHPCSPSSLYACLTVQNSLTDIQTISQLRGTENMRHVYMSDARARVLPRASLDSEKPVFWDEAVANTANAAVNAGASVPNPTNCGAGSCAAYTAAEFACVLAYLNSNPGQSIAGMNYVRGDVQIGGTARIACGGGRPTNRALASDLVIRDGTLVVEGDLTMSNNTTLTIQHDILNPVPAVADAARQMVALALFPNGSSRGRFIMQGGALQRFVADGLVYTSDGMEVGQQALVDVIGAMYHRTANNTLPSFDNINGTTVLRFDPLATRRLRSFGIEILSWQQLR